MQYVYQLYNKKDECIYVGRTTKLASRFSQHKKDKSWFDEVEYIMYAQCLKEYMIDMYELYYINTIHPKYNKKDINIKHFEFNHEPLNFKNYKNFKKDNKIMVNYLGNAVLPIITPKDNLINNYEKIHFINIKNQQNMKQNVSHHILLADCSGSMSGSIKSLKAKIIEVAETLLKIPNSYLSVITYSGHNEACRILSAIKCDETTYNMNNVYETLNKEIFVKGVTVMSEPLQTSIDICSNLLGVCDKNHIALFTDGCLVPTKWGFKEEENKCYEIAKICNERNIFLNAIGFGQYYDRKFLSNLINIAGKGNITHIDYINNYYDVIINAISQINKIELIKNNLELNEHNIGFDLINNIMLKDKCVCYGQNLILAIKDSDSIKINDEIYKFCEAENNKDNKNKQVAQDIIDDYLYNVAKYYIDIEEIESYEYVVKFIGDKKLYENTKDCYSFVEKGKCLNLINSLLDNKKLRFEEGRINYDLKLEQDSLCVLELLQIILNDENSVLFWDLKTPYNRITQKTITNEDNIKFEKLNKGLIPVNDLSIGKEKLNIGIKVGISGTVTDTISKLSREAKIYRDYNLVNGGNINVLYINAKLSDEIYKELAPYNILEVNQEYSIKNIVTIYKIDLTKLKSANKRILKSMNLVQLRDALKKSNELYCKNWAINKRIKELTELKDTDKLEYSDNISFEEKEILRALRIDEKGVYSFLSIEKDTETKFDVYPALHITWSLKFSEKKMKDEMMSKIIKISDISQLLEELNKTRKEKRVLDLKINLVRIASGTMNKNVFLFDTKIEKNKTVNDKILGINTIVNGVVQEYKKVIDDDVITQQKWLQMIPCN